jgi:hypothetical protein
MWELRDESESDRAWWFCEIPADNDYTHANWQIPPGRGGDFFKEDIVRCGTGCFVLSRTIWNSQKTKAAVTARHVLRHLWQVPRRIFGIGTVISQPRPPVLGVYRASLVNAG